MNSESSSINNQSDRTEKEKANLIAELQQLGIKCTSEKIIRIAKLFSGKIIFLERGKAGDKGSGLEHILENHLQDFLNRGISQVQISEAIIKAITEGKPRGTQGKSRTIYEVELSGIIHYISIEISNNGYIVGANPTPQRLINKLKGVNEYEN